MNTEQSGISRRALAAVSAVVVGVVAAAAVNELASLLFLRVVAQGPLSIAVGFPGSLAVGLGAGLTVYRTVGGPPGRSAAGVAVLAGGLTYFAGGGLLGVAIDIADGPFEELVLTVAVAFLGAVLVTIGVYQSLAPADAARVTTGRRVVAALGAAVAGIGGALVLFVALTEVLSRFIWLSIFVSGPVAIVAGLGLTILVYRAVTARFAAASGR